VGNAVGGIAGMFLALPAMAILKIIFERVPSLRPWAILLGEDDQAPRVPTDQTVVGQVAQAVRQSEA
jgi:hypothetical protein